MRTGFSLLAAMVVMSLASPAQAQLVKLQGVWDETGKTYQTIDWDLVTGWPIVECAMSDGTGAALQSTAGALHVSVAALPLPAGAATAAKQDAQTALLTTIDADTGILAADPATATLQGTGNTSLATIAGDTTSIDTKVCTEATLLGVCTEATCATLATEATIATLATEVTLAGVCLESGGNLDTIAGDTTSLDAKIPALGTALTAASLPVNIASDQTVPISAAALPLPTGAATEATSASILADTADIETNTDFGATTGGGVELGALRVTIANDSTGLVSIDDNGASITVDGTFWQATQPVSGTFWQATQPISAAALPLPTGAATEATLATIDADTGNIATDTAVIAGDTTSIDGKITACDTGNVTIGASIPAGTNYVGKVRLTDGATDAMVDNGAVYDGQFVRLTDGTNVSSLSGTGDLEVCANGGASLALEGGGNLATIAGDTTSLDGKTPALGQALMAASTPVAIASDQSTLPISAAALPLPAGAATSALQLPDGHNVTVDNAGAGAAVNIQDGGNSITVDGTFWPALGQALMAASLPVAIASNQSMIPVNTATGTVTDSAAAAQDLLWRNVADGGATADAGKGVIALPLIAGTVVKLYQLPVAKQFHEIAITETDSSADFDYTVQVFALNEVPSAAWALADYLSVGALVVPSYRLSLDRTETVVSQPLVRTHALYLAFVINTMTVSPAAVSPRVRILSYNDGDSR